VIARLKRMAVRAQIRGIKLIGATLTPFRNETYMANAWTRRAKSIGPQSTNGSAKAAHSTALRISIWRCATPSTRPRCRRSTIAVTACTNCCKMGDVIDLALFD
jgi:hypothetical protein